LQVDREENAVHIDVDFIKARNVSWFLMTAYLV